MRITPIIAGVAAGGVLALGGVAAADLATGDAEAQSSDGQTVNQSSSAELKAANQRSQAAIRLAKDLQNKLGKYLQPEGLLIGANPPPPPIRQDRGTGDGGLVTSTIKNGAITNPKLGDNSVTESKLNAGAVTTAKVADGAITPSKLANGLVVDVMEERSVAAGSGPQELEVFCPPGSSPITGGYFAEFKAHGLQLIRGYDWCERPGARWMVLYGRNPLGEPSSRIVVDVSCIDNQARGARRSLPTSRVHATCVSP